jgi:predicted RNase H-like HicB family nuclease
MRQVVIYAGEDGAWVAHVPSLPGCVSEGPTRETVLRNITEAAEMWIQTQRGLGEAVPDDPRSAGVVELPGFTGR